jgi:4-amino-4-deoxy-L-arabinose transferase-like glycosyltransferase
MRLAPSTLSWLAILLLALFVHIFGLGGQYVPTNGDEMVYAHIARETAETHQWLPLASELFETRNTKPPLLFWQAIVAGDWGAHWSLFALRAPSVIYSLLIAAAIGWTVYRIRHQPQDALIAVCVFLSFFSTYRYGRAYLTSAPETFWFSLPLLGLLWQKLREGHADKRPGWWLHALFGLGLGLGLAYKSFALIAPAAAAWWLAQVVSEPRFDWRVVLQISLRVASSAVLALAVFGLWFVLDPDPSAVWQEFIVGENSSKFSDSRGYWHEALLGGGSSLWAQLLAYAVNAGLLGFAVIGLAWTGWRSRGRLRPLASISPPVRILLAWALVWLIVFTLPSQRSARYVIPAMPAIAILLSLYWREIGRRWFLPVLLLSGVVLLLLARIAWASHDLGLSNGSELGLTLLAAGLGVAVILAGWLRANWSRASSVLACLLVYATFEFTVAPLDGPAGLYPPDSAASLSSQARIAVPNGFNGQFERYQFLLGRHVYIPYDTDARVKAAQRDTPAQQQLSQLLQTHEAVVWSASSAIQNSPPCQKSECTLLGSRWQFKSRHLPGEVRWDNLWYPQDWLFRREWLLTRASAR